MQPKEVAGLEPLAPPFVLHAWQRLLRNPVLRITLGTKLSELVRLS